MRQDLVILRRVMAFFWPSGDSALKWRISTALAAMLLAKLIVVGVPVLYKYVIDEFTGLSEAAQTITGLVLFLIFAYAIGRFASVALIQLRDVLFVGVLHKARRALATDTFRRILNLDYGFFLQNKVGEIQQKVDRGVRAVSSLTDYLLFNIVPTLFEITVSSIVIAIFLSPLHALVVAGSATAYVVFTILATEWRLKYRKELNAAENTSKGIAVDAVMNVEIIKLHAAENFEVRRYHDALERYEDKSISNAVTLSVVNLGQAGIIAAALMFILITVGIGVLNGTYTIGQFSMVNIYLLQVFTPLGMLGFVYRQVRFGLTDLSGMFEMIDDKLPGSQEKVGRQIDTLSQVTFDNVTFTFPNQETPALSDINFSVSPGQVVGIVGPTGAGKSTILRLLFGLHHPQKGAVLANGVPLAEIDPESYRRHLAIVPQDTILFHDTLRNNIVYGLDTVDDSQVMKAARQAQISDDLISGPEGLDRVVGERGGSISGGQRQRVALARALLRKPSLLVMDEATSALDSATERNVIEHAYELARTTGTAIVIVTHKIANVAKADQILVIEDGRVRQQGTHDELLSSQSTYAHLSIVPEESTA
ncbi:MAG: ATP-binding cassette domain-containing protein [Paracoccus sp. (in: a-proteobacteria)]|nr:ATP-binding cassette domain-containing protein [Paracoccus sp. (in: a-proteobacteria)]